MPKGRPGGNPDLVNHQFKSGRSEPLSEQVTLRISPTMKKYLADQTIPNWRELTRQYLAGLLRESGHRTPDY